MRSKVIGQVIVALTLFAGDARLLHASPKQVEPLPSKEWAPLGMITGFHSVSHKASGLELRVLEADGSASVAENPVQIFIVATNGGTSDLVEHIWLLPKTVSRVRKVTPTSCGITLLTDVDVAQEDSPFLAHKTANLKMCFIGTKGRLEETLQLFEDKVVDDGGQKNTTEEKLAKPRP